MKQFILYPDHLIVNYPVDEDQMELFNDLRKKVKNNIKLNFKNYGFDHKKEELVNLTDSVIHNRYFHFIDVDKKIKLINCRIEGLTAVDTFPILNRCSIGKLSISNTKVSSLKENVIENAEFINVSGNLEIECQEMLVIESNVSVKVKTNVLEVNRSEVEVYGECKNHFFSIDSKIVDIDLKIPVESYSIEAINERNNNEPIWCDGFTFPIYYDSSSKKMIRYSEPSNVDTFNFFFLTGKIKFIDVKVGGFTLGDAQIEVRNIKANDLDFNSSYFKAVNITARRFLISQSTVTAKTTTTKKFKAFNSNSSFTLT